MNHSAYVDSGIAKIPTIKIINPGVRGWSYMSRSWIKILCITSQRIDSDIDTMVMNTDFALASPIGQGYVLLYMFI